MAGCVRLISIPEFSFTQEQQQHIEFVECDWLIIIARGLYGFSVFLRQQHRRRNTISIRGTPRRIARFQATGKLFIALGFL